MKKEFSSSWTSCSHLNVWFIFFVHFDSTMGNMWWCCQEFTLCFFVIVSNDFLLFLTEWQESWFLLSTHSLEFLKSFLHLSLNLWQNNVIAIGHLSSSDSIKSSFKRGSFDFFWMRRIINIAENFINWTLNNIFHLILQVWLFKVLNWIQHWNCSVMERSFCIKLTVSKEVDKSSFLNILVFCINSFVLNLFFGVSKVLTLRSFNTISPHIWHLSVFIVRVDIVEDCEFWSNKVCEMS